jgi:hypothetical protein
MHRPNRNLYLTASGHREALIALLDRQRRDLAYAAGGGIYARRVLSAEVASLALLTEGQRPV